MNLVFLGTLKLFESGTISQNLRFQKDATKKKSNEKKKSQRSTDLQKEYEKYRSLQIAQKDEKSYFLEFLEEKKNSIF